VKPVIRNNVTSYRTWNANDRYMLWKKSLNKSDIISLDFAFNRFLWNYL